MKFVVTAASGAQRKEACMKARAIGLMFAITA